MCLVLAEYDVQRKITHLALLAISSQPPLPRRVAVEIPEIERRRAGLDSHVPAWVTVDEYNYDIAERSFYYRPHDAPLGTFSARFLATIARAFMPVLRSGGASVDRTGL